MVVVYDDFPGPDGGLIGTVAVSGQTWVATIAPYDDLAIVSHQAFGVADDQNGAQIDGTIDLSTFHGAWWIRFTSVLGALPPTQKSIGCWLGDDDVGPYFGVALVYQPPQASGTVKFLAGQLDSGGVSGTVAGVDTSVLHEVVMQFDPIGSTLKIYFDDALLGTFPGVTVDPTTSSVFVVSPACGAAASPAGFGEVELGQGVYAIG